MEKLLEKASESLDTLRSLKVLLCNVGMYEEAAKLRETEKERFPILEENLKIKEEAELFQHILIQVGLGEIQLSAIIKIMLAYESYKGVGKEFCFENSQQVQQKSREISNNLRL